MKAKRTKKRKRVPPVIRVWTDNPQFELLLRASVERVQNRAIIDVLCKALDIHIKALNDSWANECSANIALGSYVRSFDDYKREKSIEIAELTGTAMRAQETANYWEWKSKPWWKRSSKRGVPCLNLS